MASTKPLQVNYSPDLDSMTAFIRQYLSRELTASARKRAHKGIEDFCFNNSPAFKRTFLEKVGVDKLQPLEAAESEKLFNEFVDKISTFDGECIFLLKDTHKALDLYQSKTNRGYGLVINRKYLCDGSEERYFTLIKPIYDSLEGSKSLNEFLDTYFHSFQNLISRDRAFHEKAKEVYEYVKFHSPKGPIIWVDFGFQYTFVLFALSAVRHFSNNSISQDFYCFTTYPWLQNFYVGKYFSEQNELALNYELQGIEAYYSSLESKAAGAVTGFAVGDALGFPAAGIDKSDLPNFFNSPITDFADNKKHPYFSELDAGQYTDNTTLMKQVAHNLIQHKGFNMPAYVNSLVQFGKSLTDDITKERWLGPTAFGAIKKLMAGTDPQSSGSTTTSSCSASYRIVPVAIHYRDSTAELVNLTRAVTSITHNSAISKDGAVILSLIIADLLRGVFPEKAASAALAGVTLTKENKNLIFNLRKAIQIHPCKSDEEARRIFGTGSPIYQTLPLTIFYFLKYQTDFEKGVIAAANSFRNSSWLEKRRLAKLSWNEQLIVAAGGNSDGIAALTGALLGAHLGLGAIPEKFTKVEDFRELAETGKRLTS